jgi:membrane fusion protein, multidrug efflux system
MNNDFLIKIKQNKYIRYLGVLVFLYLCYGIYVWSNTETTDNAYIDADIAMVSPEISGVIKEVLVGENSNVEYNQVVAVVDDADYKATYAKAVAALNGGEEDVKIATQNIAIAKINLEKSNSGLISAKTNYELASVDYQRMLDLNKDKFASQKLLDNAKSKYEETKSTYSQAVLDVESDTKNLLLLDAQKAAREAAYAGLVQAKNLAERDLNNTRLKSPIVGVIANTNSSLVIGNYVQPGVILYSIVPRKLYIRANFKETQIVKIKTGMRATLKFDALPGKKIQGIVRNFSPATGSKFTLLPPDNATGNFTKIVQRLPIIIDFEIPEGANLGPGMSAIVSIKTNQ